MANDFLKEVAADGTIENHRINTGELWWAWVDLNHRPRPYQDSVVRSYKDLQVPRGLPKTAQVSVLDRLRPVATESRGLLAAAILL